MYNCKSYRRDMQRAWKQMMPYLTKGTTAPFRAAFSKGKTATELGNWIAMCFVIVIFSAASLFFTLRLTPIFVQYVHKKLNPAP